MRKKRATCGKEVGQRRRIKIEENGCWKQLEFIINIYESSKNSSFLFKITIIYLKKYSLKCDY